MADPAKVRLRDGAELWTAVTGTGPPVVCLHGGPGLWDYLAPLAALIDDTFTVVRFDRPPPIALVRRCSWRARSTPW